MADDGTHLFDLPPALLTRVALLCISNDLHAFWTLIQVSKQFAQLAEQAASSLEELDMKLLLFPKRVFAPRSPRPFLRLLRCLRGVRSLALDGAYSPVVYNLMDDSALRTVGRHCRQLQRLELKACEKVTAAGLQAAVTSGGLQGLEVLVLRSCRDIGDGRFLRHLKHLRHLDISWCFSVHASEVAAVSRQLQHLSAVGCDHLDDTICSQLPAIQHLDIRLTPITDQGLLMLAQRSPDLRFLCLAWRMSNIWLDANWSEAGLRQLQALRPDIRVEFGTA